MPNAALLDRARTVAGRIDRDPEWFAETVLGHDHWETPRAILRAIAQPHARVAVKACHSSGKSFTAADAVLRHTIAGGICLTTAPTWTQVERVLWGYIHHAYHGARYPLGGTLNRTELRLTGDAYAIGLSTNEGVRFQGWHGTILVVLDEAPGVRPDIWEAIEGIRAGGDVRVLALGNPTVPSGPFYDAFAPHRSGWTTLTIDAFSTPNLSGLFVPDARPETMTDDEAVAPLLALPDAELDVNPRPYLTTRRWVLEKWNEWGPSSPLWQARVRGRFPAQSEDALLSLAWLEAAQHRDTEPADGDAWEAGIDVAGPGEDETVLAIRHGAQIVALRSWPQPDPRGDVLAALVPYRERLTRVKVDSVGQGYYFARHLEDNGYAGRIEDVNVGEAAADTEKYANLKAELYWGLRLRLQAGDIGGLADDTAVAQLAGIRYRHNARGQVVIESKDEARKRGVKSPDRAEALMLAFAPGAPVAAEAVLDRQSPFARQEMGGVFGRSTGEFVKRSWV